MTLDQKLKAHEERERIDLLNEAFFTWSQHRDLCDVWGDAKAVCNCGLQNVADKILEDIDADNAALLSGESPAKPSGEGE